MRLIRNDQVAARLVEVTGKQQMRVRHGDGIRVTAVRKRIEIEVGIGKGIEPTRTKFAGVIQCATLNG